MANDGKTRVGREMSAPVPLYPHGGLVAAWAVPRNKI